jgi:hypothetical protein
MMNWEEGNVSECGNITFTITRFFGGTEGNHVNTQSGVAGRGTDTRDLPHIK